MLLPDSGVRVNNGEDMGCEGRGCVGVRVHFAFRSDDKCAGATDVTFDAAIDRAGDAGDDMLVEETAESPADEDAG